MSNTQDDLPIIESTIEKQAESDAKNSEEPYDQYLAEEPGPFEILATEELNDVDPSRSV